jgi:hypothetical protein
MKIDIGLVTDLSNRFRKLEFESRLEILFKCRPKIFKVHSHNVFTHQSEYELVILEVETRVTAKYIPSGADY